MRIDQEALLREIRRHVRWGSFTTSAGLRTNYLIDLLPVLASPVHRGSIVAWVRARAEEYRADAVAGIELGGALIAVATGLPAVIVRKDKTVVGTGPCRVVLVDDVVTTGKSLRSAFQLLTLSNYPVTGVMCVVDRGEHEMELHRLFTAKEVLGK